MLDLNISQAIEPILVGILQYAQRIPESERWLQKTLDNKNNRESIDFTWAPSSFSKDILRDCLGRLLEGAKAWAPTSREARRTSIGREGGMAWQV